MRIESMAPRLIATPAIASMATMPAAQQSKDTIFFMFLSLSKRQKKNPITGIIIKIGVYIT